MNIKVPEGMLKATENAISTDASYFDRESIIEAALRWQSENPPVPTQEMAEALYADALANKAQNTHIASFVCVLWIRRMYLAPEPDQAANRVIRSMSGCTFTPAEAEAIVEELSHISHGWIKPQTTLKSIREDIIAQHAEAASRDFKARHPEAVKDLLYSPNESVIDPENNARFFGAERGKAGK